MFQHMKLIINSRIHRNRFKPLKNEALGFRTMTRSFGFAETTLVDVRVCARQSAQSAVQKANASV